LAGAKSNHQKTINEIKSTINKHVGQRANTSKLFRKGKQTDQTLEMMSAEQQAIFFEQMKIAINNRERENQNKGEVETQLQGHDPPPTPISSGFARPPPLSSIRTGRFTPRFRVPSPEPGFISNNRGGLASTQSIPTTPQEPHQQRFATTPESYNALRMPTQYCNVQPIMYSAVAIK